MTNKLTKLVDGAAMAAVISLAAPAALAGPEPGERSLALTGSGTSDDSFDVNSFSVSGQIGWWTSDSLELGIRQSANGTIRDDASDNWAGSTRGYVDMHFGDLGAGGTGALPFIGANIGGIYGDGVDETGAAGLELGAKFYVREKTFIMAMAEYQFLFESADDIDDNFEDGAFFYTLGIGYNF
ncbi:MAG: hypothetical protein ACODAC_04950 [Pseudomonadota bacterium]